MLRLSRGARIRTQGYVDCDRGKIKQNKRRGVIFLFRDYDAVVMPRKTRYCEIELRRY